MTIKEFIRNLFSKDSDKENLENILSPSFPGWLAIALGLYVRQWEYDERMYFNKKRQESLEYMKKYYEIKNLK